MARLELGCVTNGGGGGLSHVGGLAVLTVRIGPARVWWGSGGVEMWRLLPVFLTVMTPMSKPIQTNKHES